jgi:hypothetical protein
MIDIDRWSFLGRLFSFGGAFEVPSLIILTVDSGTTLVVFYSIAN